MITSKELEMQIVGEGINGHALQWMSLGCAGPRVASSCLHMCQQPIASIG
jgi:hypothetical protein